MDKKHSQIKFLGKAILFCLPLVIIIGFPVFVLYRTGEFMSNNAMAARQAEDPHALLGLTFSNPVYYTQLKATLLKKPEILVLGSSRVQQIRPGFFGAKASSSVFIAAGTAQKIAYFRHFLEKIPVDQSPKVLVLGLDQKFFNPNYDSLAPDNIDDLLTKPTTPGEVFGNWFSVYRYYFQHKFSLADVVHAPSSSIGLWAIELGAGYRSDGSHAPGNVPEADDPTISNIENGIAGFEPSKTVSDPALKELDELLSLAKARNIYVVGILPPFAPSVYAKIQTLPDQFGYLKDLPGDINVIFKKYQFGFYDYTNPASLGLSESQFQDGIHLSEQGSAVLLGNIMSKSRTLLSYSGE